MRNLFLELLFAMIAFVICKMIFKILYMILRNILKISKSKEKKFDFFISLAMQVIFIIIWMKTITIVMNGVSDLELYMSFCLLGIFCIIWCYFSWDAECIFSKPQVAAPEDRRIKKVIVYLLIFVFSLYQGYCQTLCILDPSIEINPVISVTNYSVILAAIALDRVMNQLICN